MTDFNNGKVYSIRSHQTQQIYIGSTTQQLCKRLYEHRQKYRRYKKTGKCQILYSSFEILQYDDHYIELIEECPCDTRQQLHRREGQIIRANECVNKLIAGRTPKEYYEENKDRLLEDKKQYYENNKDELNAKNKQYYEKNKDKIAVRMKEYNKNNKDRLNVKRTEKIACGCGSIFSKCYNYKHKKTKKHLRWVEQNKK